MAPDGPLVGSGPGDLSRWLGRPGTPTQRVADPDTDPRCRPCYRHSGPRVSRTMCSARRSTASSSTQPRRWPTGWQHSLVATTGHGLVSTATRGDTLRNMVSQLGALGVVTELPGSTDSAFPQRDAGGDGRRLSRRARSDLEFVMGGNRPDGVGRRADYDVVVIGGGPAGAAAATTLPRTGRAVLVLAGRRSHRTIAVGEGAPPGLDQTVDDVFGSGTFAAADHLRSLGNRVAWGSDDLVRTDFMFSPFGAGWHLDRIAFDARLLAAAAGAGATVSDRIAEASREMTAPVVIDASGRRAVHCRRHGAQRVVGDRLTALVAMYPAGLLDVDSTTTVEAAEHGWWYTCPVPGHRRVVAFLTDGDLLVDEWRSSRGFDRAARRTNHIAAHLDSTLLRARLGRGGHSPPQSLRRAWVARCRRCGSQLRPAVVAGHLDCRPDGPRSGRA